jgi:hypothetical protein
VVRISSDQHQRVRHREDNFQMPFWALLVFGHVPFGLTNAPSTFHSCMNHIFRGNLRKYHLVFFDDILIYNKTWAEHFAHLEEVLGIMQAQSLYSKESKCEFGMRELLYLGHIISEHGV